MSILMDVLKELFSMFMGDARLTASIIAVIAVAAALIFLTDLPALVGGAFLLCGCLTVLIVSVRQEAKRRESGHL